MYLWITQTRQREDSRLVRHLAELRYEREGTRSFQLQVQNDQVEDFAFDHLQCFRAVAGHRGDLQSRVVLDQQPQSFADHELVVDDEDANSLRSWLHCCGHDRYGAAQVQRTSMPILNGRK